MLRITWAILYIVVGFVNIILLNSIHCINIYDIMASKKQSKGHNNDRPLPVSSNEEADTKDLISFLAF